MSGTLLLEPVESCVSNAYDCLGKNWEEDPRISMVIWPLYSLGSSARVLSPAGKLVTFMLATMRGSSRMGVSVVIWTKGSVDSFMYTHDPSSSVAASKWLMADGSVHPLTAAHVPSVEHCEKQVLTVKDDVTLSK